MQGDGASRPAYRLVDVVARRLHCAATNMGVGGSLSTDTADLLTRQPPPVSPVYVVMTGLNDARLRGASLASLEEFSTALESIFRSFHAVNQAALVVAVEQPHLTDYSLHAPHDRGSNEIVDAYNRRLRTVAGRHGVVSVGVAGWHPETMLSADMVHPNDAGHAQVAAA
ncbi:MAG TPA: SGNH/GDSL hydrolase family protein, partial [Actinomycetes bacterium]|nr:SGNH/GDSL hydrolase family protein [Actinomycetes bacterium]